jgi:hypothetical protein
VHSTTQIPKLQSACQIHPFADTVSLHKDANANVSALWVKPIRNKFPVANDLRPSEFA